MHGNATATANNIAAHETLFRFGIAGDLFTGNLVIFVVLTLYRLFKEVDQNQAMLMVIPDCVLPSAIYFFNSTMRLDGPKFRLWARARSAAIGIRYREPVSAT